MDNVPRTHNTFGDRSFAVAVNFIFISLSLSLTLYVRNVTHATRARWIGRNSGHIFRHLWTKVHPIKYAYAGELAVCIAVFRSTISSFVPEIFAIRSRVI